MLKNARSKLRFGSLLLGLAVIFSSFLFPLSSFYAYAITGPTTAPGVGSGAIRTDASNNIGIGVAPGSDTRFTIQGTTADGTAYGLVVKSSTGTNVFTIRNDAKVVVGTTASSTLLSVAGDIWTNGTVYASTFSGPVSGTLNAANVSAGQFGANTGGGNYSFPATVTIGSSNTVAFTAISLGGAGQTQYANFVLTSDGGNAQIWKSGSAYSSYGGVNALNIYTSSGPIAFHTGSVTNAVYIKSDGNVGIGTTGPAHKLEVAGFASSDTVSGLKVATTGWGSVTNPMVYFYSGASGDGRVLRLQNNGARTDTSIFDIVNSAGTIFYVQGNGNVGIGTTGPNYKLHVAGATDILDVQGATNAFYRATNK
ncbi:MAG: hypothetical protein AAB686_03405, partial [Patescibacteria group bacterium]